MENGKIRVGITHGDTNGVGYELILKAFADPSLAELCLPIVYGSPKVATYHRKLLQSQTNFTLIQSPEEAVPGMLNMITCFDEEIEVNIGHPTPESGRAAMLSLNKALEDYQAGLIDVIVTCPINKKNIQSEQFHFIGHTEYFEEKAGEGHEALMMMMNSQLKVALVTTHLPMKDIASVITQERVEKKLQIFNDSLKNDFLISIPRIAVLSLNPHNGEEGLLGREEQEVIQPAIEAMRQKGVQCFGPYPADGFFGASLYTHFDGVLAMYHDQGLAPFKTLSMSDGVNFTAGLPIVRTSPDHGTAYDIAGKGEADENSFRQAIYMAIDIWRNRRRNEQAGAHPLKIIQPERDNKSYAQRNQQTQVE